MSQALALRDHDAVQSAVVRTLLAGAAAGLVHSLVPGPVSDALALFLVGVAAVPPRSLRSAAVAASLACGAAAAMASLPSVLGLAAVALTAGALFARDPAPGDEGAGRRLLSGMAGMAAMAGGLFVAEGLLAGALAGVPPLLSWMTAGGAAGLVAGLGVTGREVVFQPVLPSGVRCGVLPESTTESLARTGPGTVLAPPRSLTAEARELDELLGHATAACHKAREALGVEAPAAARAAQSLLERIASFARRWRELDGQLAQTDRAELTARRDRVAERARNAVDEQVRTEYLRAAGALGQQIDDLDAIRGWQERSLARLHHHVAVLERLHLAALHRRSVATGRSGDELESLVEELSTAGLELDGAAEILAELPAAT